MVCPRGEREHYAPRSLDIFPARGLAWRGRSVAKPTRERAGVCVGAKRSEAPQGRESEGRGKPAQMGKRGGASATNGSTNPGGMSVSAYGRGRAAGAWNVGRRLRPARGEGAQAGREERAAARNRGAPQRLDRYISTGRRAAGARCARPTDTIGSPRPSAESRGRGRIRRAAKTTRRMGYTPHGRVGRGAKGRGGREPSNGKRPQIGWVEYVSPTICLSGLILKRFSREHAKPYRQQWVVDAIM